MINKLRIPTKDPYAFVEVDVEDKTALEVKQIYDEYIKTFNPRPISEDLAEYLINIFNEDLDKEAWMKMSPEEYMELPNKHKDLIQAIKIFKNRLPKE